jgi:membrane associated rhomboid family serine protease
VLLALNVAVFVVTAAQAGSLSDVLGSPVFTDGALFGPFMADGEYWRLLTAGFLHFSLIHVAVNMFSLYILGRDVEMTLGTARFVGIYLVSLLGGSAMVMLLESPNSINAGASGAIFGLMGATLVVVLRAKIPAGFVLGVIGLNIVLSLTIPNISLWAHLGGLIFGAAAAAGILYGPGLLPARSRNARSVSAVGWLTIAALVVLALLIGVVRAATLTV